MRKLTPHTSVPFAVSLLLIFGYSLLMAVVPPTSIAQARADQALVNSPIPKATTRLVKLTNADIPPPPQP